MCCKKAIADGFGDIKTCNKEGTSGKCCIYTGPVSSDCLFYENLESDADLDGRCTQVNQGMSCAWNYSDAGKIASAVEHLKGIRGFILTLLIGTSGFRYCTDCCDKALADGFNSLGVVC